MVQNRLPHQTLSIIPNQARRLDTSPSSATYYHNIIYFNIYLNTCLRAYALYTL